MTWSGHSHQAQPEGQGEEASDRLQAQGGLQPEDDEHGGQNGGGKGDGEGDGGGKTGAKSDGKGDGGGDGKADGGKKGGGGDVGGAAKGDGGGDGKAGAGKKEEVVMLAAQQRVTVAVLVRPVEEKRRTWCRKG